MNSEIKKKKMQTFSLQHFQLRLIHLNHKFNLKLFDLGIKCLGNSACFKKFIVRTQKLKATI